MLKHSCWEGVDDVVKVIAESDWPQVDPVDGVKETVRLLMLG